MKEYSLIEQFITLARTLKHRHYHGRGAVNVAHHGQGRILALLAMEEDGEIVFLASQFAAVMAGFFHHDECLTVLQAIGLQALLKSIQQQGKEN